MVGIVISPNNNNINHVKLGPIEAIYYSVKEIFFVSQKTLEIVWGYLQKLWGQGYGDLRQLGGPIKIAQVSGDFAKLGLLPFIMIISSYIFIRRWILDLYLIGQSIKGYVETFMMNLETSNKLDFPLLNYPLQPKFSF